MPTEGLGPTCCWPLVFHLARLTYGIPPNSLSYDFLTLLKALYVTPISSTLRNKSPSAWDRCC